MFKPQSRGMLRVLAASVAIASVLPMAQASAEEKITEEVVVTGSRIARSNLVQPNPVYGMSADDIKASGDLSLGDALRSVPALLGSDTSADSAYFGTDSNTGLDNTPGLATLNLRNLGTNRTLVLVDGKRHVSGQAGNQAVDVSTIPTALLERVEVLTGGASSIYGADAVSGVVNFVMKHDYDGMEFNFQGGEAPDGNYGGEYQGSFVFGRNLFDNRLNVTFSASHTEHQAIRSRDRGYARDSGIANLQNVNSDLNFQNGDPLPAGVLPGDAISTTDAGGNCVANVPGTDPSLLSRACNAKPQRIARHMRFGLSHGGGLLGVSLGNYDYGTGTFDPSKAAAFPAFTSSYNNGNLAPGTPVLDTDNNGVDDCVQSYVGGYDVGGCVIVDPTTGMLRPFNTGQIADSVLNFDAIGGDGTNQGTYDNTILDPQYRQTVLTSSFDFKVSDSMTAYGDFKYVRSTTEVGGGSIAYFDTINISPDNPYVPQGLQDYLAQVLALNPQYADSAQFFMTRDPDDIHNNGRYDRETFRIVTGLKGDFWDTWNYDLSLNWGRTNEDGKQQKLLNDRWLAALDVVTGPDGNPVCRAQIDPNWVPNDFNNDSITSYTGALSFTPGDGTCQPANAFGRGNISVAAQNFIAPYDVTNDYVEQRDASFVVTGDSARFFSLPAGPIGLAFGAEYRKEEAETRPSAFEQAAITFNGGTQITKGDYDVKEFFAEVSVPVLQNLPMAQELSLDGSYRLSDYSLSVGTTSSYGYGFSWTPLPDIRFRGTKSRAVRAPNIFELFAPQQQARFNLDLDPCDASAIANFVASGDPKAQNRIDNCAADPLVGPGFVNPLTSGFNGLSGGNPNLKEETSDTYTVGVVLTPRWVDDLVVTVDYWDIEIKDAIQQIQARDILQGCYDGPALDQSLCSKFTRVSDPTSAFYGGLNFLQTGQVNFAKLTTSGVDFEVTYALDELLGGMLSARMNGTWLKELTEYRSVLNPGLGDRQDTEMRAPEWSGSMGLTWVKGALTLGYNVRYLDKQVMLVQQEQVPVTANAVTDPYYIQSISVAYDASESLSFNGGIQNLTDKDPYPSQPSFPVGVRGRYVYFGVTARM